MIIITATKLNTMAEEKPKLFSELLPELVKRLILAGNKKIKRLRIPSMDDVWAPGFDGVVECEEGTRFVNPGYSVWEFGTNKDTLKKLNEDYLKRTNNPGGLNKGKTSFYLVTPKTWAYKTKSITEWERERNDWFSTRVYDASILADWINSEPAVCAWLLEKTGNANNLDFSTVAFAWDKLANKTAPPLTHLMFVGGRERESSLFINALSRSTICIKADTFVESIGFALSVLIQNTELAEQTIVVNNSETYRSLASICENKLFLINYRIGEDLIPSNNSVILCYNKEALSDKEFVVLPSITKSEYERALGDMGIEVSNVKTLYAFTHGNIRALVRRIPGISTEKSPDWATEKDIVLLVPLMFLRSFCIETDQKLVEMLSGEEYEVIENKYREMLRLEDSPLKKTDKYYTIVDYESTFFALDIEPCDKAFQRLTDTTIQILSTLAEKGSWNDKSAYDYTLHRLMHALFFNYVYFSYEHQSASELIDAVQRILPFVFKDNTSKIVIENLHLFAEAEPELVVSFLETELNSSNHLLLDLFLRESYDSMYTGILSALDELVLHNQTAVRACKILFKLYLLGKEYKLGNSPENSLRSAMNLWNNRGELTLKQKTELFLSFIANNPEKGSILFAAVISTRTSFRSIRLGAKELPIEPITYADVFTAIEEVGGAAFEYAIKNDSSELLGSLLESYFLFPPEFLTRFAVRVNLEENNESIWLQTNYKLRRIVYNIQKYKIEERSSYLDCLKEWISHTTPIEPPLSLMWAFTKPYECFAEELLFLSEDPLEEREAAEKIRIRLLSDLVENYGLSAGLQVVNKLEDDIAWSKTLSTAFKGNYLNSLFETLLIQNKYRIAGGVLNWVNKQTADSLFYQLDEDDVLQILPYVVRKDSYEWLNSPQKEKQFWASKTMTEYDPISYQKLLEYNPAGLLLYCYQQTGKDLAHSIELSVEVLRAINEFLERGEAQKEHVEVFLEEIIRTIDKAFYSDAWASICLELLKKHYVNHLTQGISTYFFLNPEVLVSYIDEEPERYYSIKETFCLPPQAYENYAQFSSFFDTLIQVKNRYPSLAGQIIGRTNCGSDGFFPHEFAREYLEKQDDYVLDNSVYIGRFNSIGVRTISDGTNERQEAEKLLRQSSTLEIKYPHSARILRLLAEDSLHEAERDQILAEIEY